MSDDKFLKYKQENIDTISDSFCAAKWLNATIWLNGGQSTSCHHPPGHNIEPADLVDNPSGIHNTPHKKQMRKMMLEGTRPSECEYCWKVEDIGRNNISDRVYKTIIYKDEDIKRISSMPWDSNVDPKTLEIAFDKACNFACSYCNPAFSSKWVKDIKDLGPYTGLEGDGRAHYTDTAEWSNRGGRDEDENPYVDAFWKWWDSSLSSNLEEIRVTGGEPLMHKSIWKLFDWFKQNPDSSMRLAINSNLVPEKDSYIERLIAASYNVKQLEIYTSNESVGLQSEYIRDGMNYTKWKENLVKLLKESNIKKIHMMMTINSLCLESITEFLDEMMDLRKEYKRRSPSISVNILRFPSFQSPAILPEELKHQYKSKIQNWLDLNRDANLLYPGEIAQLQRLIDYLDVVKTPHRHTSATETLYKDFKRFWIQYDARRGKNFVEAFPSFSNWYNSIDAEVDTTAHRKIFNPLSADAYVDD